MGTEPTITEGLPLFCGTRDQGFALRKFVDFAVGRPFRPMRPRNVFSPISQAMWADAIFVRDFSRLDTYSDEELIKAATILHLLYQSYDLVGLFLRRFDRRRGGALWRRYSDVLKNFELPCTAVTFMTHRTSARTRYMSC